MTRFLFAAPPALPIPVALALYLIGGLIVGALYFGALGGTCAGWSARAAWSRSSG